MRRKDGKGGREGGRGRGRGTGTGRGMRDTTIQIIFIGFLDVVCNPFPSSRNIFAGQMKWMSGLATTIFPTQCNIMIMIIIII